MARPIATRFRIEGILVAKTPLHVGGATEAIATDLPLAVDGCGRFYIPGTSLAGALRNWMADAFGDDLTTRLWGPANADFASQILVEDATITLKEGDRLHAEIRDGVGIDRVEGRAADHIKYDRQVLPSGTKLDFAATFEVAYFPSELRDRLQKRVDASKDEAKEEAQEHLNAAERALHRDETTVAAALGHMLEALIGEGARLGAAKTRGLGWVRLELPRIWKDDLKSPEGILGILKGKSPTVNGAAALTAMAPCGFAPKRRAYLDVTITWKPAGPVMVKADAAGVAVDMLPLVGAADGGLAQIIPGSSIKGVLRAHAERIAATVLNKKADYDAPAGRDRFIDQVARCAIVETLFGAARKPAAGGADASADGIPLPGLGAVSVEDCIAEAQIDRETWRQILEAGGSGNKKSMQPLLDVLKTTGWKNHYPATHVAIDRWTGGAAEGFLYSVLEPSVADAWPAITMSVALDRLADDRDRDFARREGETDHAWEERRRKRAKEREETRLAALALLFLTLRDFAGGRIPLGFGANRGLGAVLVESIKLKARGFADDDVSELSTMLRKLEAITFGRTLFEDPNDTAWETIELVLDPLQTAWMDYRTRQNEPAEAGAAR